MKIAVLGNSKFTISCFEALKKVDLNSMLYIHDPEYYLVKSKSFFKKLNKMFKENQ